MTGVREAQAGLGFARGQLWLVRSDAWEPGRWEISADPYKPEYDWRVRLYGSRSHILARYKAQEGESDRRNNNVRTTQRLKRIREVVDKVRSGAGR